VRAFVPTEFAHLVIERLGQGLVLSRGAGMNTPTRRSAVVGCAEAVDTISASPPTRNRRLGFVSSGIAPLLQGLAGCTL
jgi:hypothetical protein